MIFRYDTNMFIVLSDEYAIVWSSVSYYDSYRFFLYGMPIYGLVYVQIEGIKTLPFDMFTHIYRNIIT